MNNPPRILVVGDYIEDRLILVEPSKFCPDAPVPAYRKISETDYSGGAAAVFDMCSTLGAVTFYDEAASGLTVKTRIVAEQEGRRQILFRLDEDSIEKPTGKWTWPNPEGKWTWPNPDLIVVSDYGKGRITQEIMDQVRASGVPFIVDPYHNTPAFYRGALAVLPCRKIAIGNWAGSAQHVIRKLDRDGCTWENAEHSPLAGVQKFPSTARNVVDPCGAGDQFTATLAVGIAQGKDMEAAIRWANAAAGMQCERWGIVPVTTQELNERGV